MELIKIYEPTITTDLSTVKHHDKNRQITINQSCAKAKRKKKTYPKDAFNPNDKSNFNFINGGNSER